MKKKREKDKWHKNVFRKRGEKLWVKAERKNFSKSDKKFNYHHYFLMSLGLLNFIFDNFSGFG